MQATREYGDLVRLSVGIELYLVSHPDHVKRVLLDNHRAYGKGKMWDAPREAIGNSLATSEGDYWLRQRRLMQPAFHRQRLASLTGLMTSAVAQGTRHWDARAQSSEPIDVLSEMKQITSDVILRSMFGTSLDHEQTARLGHAAATIMKGLSRLMWAVLLPRVIPVPGLARFRRAVAELDRFVFALIDERRASGKPVSDLLGMLLDARDEATGEGMTSEQLRDEVIAMMIAGYETTALALTWTWYALAQHPQVRERLQRELASELAGGAPSFESLARLSWTRMTIEETLRLYSPGWAIPRQALADDTIGGYRIPAGSIILICHNVTARNAAFWPEPLVFDPTRFAAGATASRHRFASLPFGGGPRQCIGNQLALMETQIVVAMLAQRFELVPVRQVQSRSVNVMIHPDPPLVARLRPIAANPPQRSSSLPANM
jgi:cytochrome P450